MKNHCAACGSNMLIEHTENSPVTYKGKQGSIETLYSVCGKCCSETVTDDQSKQNQRLLMAFKKVSEGFLTGKEILRLRESLCITQSEASLIFGGGPNAFTKYENDDVMQSAAMDKLIRLAGEFPEVFASLLKKSGIAVYERRIDSPRLSPRVQVLRRDDNSLFLSGYESRPFSANYHKSLSVSH